MHVRTVVANQTLLDATVGLASRTASLSTSQSEKNVKYKATAAVSRIAKHINATRLLTSFFLRFLTGSGVSNSGEAAAPAARFLTLITTCTQKGRAGTVNSDLIRRNSKMIREATALIFGCHT